MSPIHGLDHWKRVETVGLDLASEYGGNPEIVRYFAILHDCMRENEGHDPLHGPKAAKYAKLNRYKIDLDENAFKLLVRACAGHTHAHPASSNDVPPDIKACWNADRFDIERVGLELDSAYLFSV